MARKIAKVSSLSEHKEQIRRGNKSPPDGYRVGASRYREQLDGSFVPTADEPKTRFELLLSEADLLQLEEAVKLSGLTAREIVRRGIPLIYGALRAADD